jgi:hypothetical protein
MLLYQNTTDWVIYKNRDFFLAVPDAVKSKIKRMEPAKGFLATASH